MSKWGNCKPIGFMAESLQRAKTVEDLKLAWAQISLRDLDQESVLPKFHPLASRFSQPCAQTTGPGTKWGYARVKIAIPCNWYLSFKPTCKRWVFLLGFHGFPSNQQEKGARQQVNPQWPWSHAPRLRSGGIASQPLR